MAATGKIVEAAQQQVSMDPLTQIPSYRHILDLYFKQSEGRQIVSHQLESFKRTPPA